jgi:uncharacterized protein
MSLSKKSYPTRGFASMDPERQQQISRKGGIASHVNGRGHEWTKETARAAGRKGGLARHLSRGPRGPRKVA